MAVNSAVVSVGITATLLNTFSDTDSVWGDAFAFSNAGAATVYLGGPGVTTSNGYPLAAGAQMAFELTPGSAIYGVVAASTCNVNVLATGV